MFLDLKIETSDDELEGNGPESHSRAIEND